MLNLHPKFSNGFLVIDDRMKIKFSEIYNSALIIK